MWKPKFLRKRAVKNNTLQDNIKVVEKYFKRDSKGRFAK